MGKSQFNSQSSINICKLMKEQKDSVDGDQGEKLFSTQISRNVKKEVADARQNLFLPPCFVDLHQGVNTQEIASCHHCNKSNQRKSDNNVKKIKKEKLPLEEFDKTGAGSDNADTSLSAPSTNETRIIKCMFRKIPPKKSRDSSKENQSPIVHKCGACGKTYNSKGSLNIHLKIHTGDNVYNCNECDKTFKLRKNLISHLRMHTGKNLHKCNKCDKIFTKKSQLRPHLKIHTQEKPYQCNECEKMFARKIYLENHLKRHTGEKPYKCKECGKAFIQKENLNDHFRIHTGEKPF